MSGDQLDLDAIEARANAATPGPWEADGLEGQIRVTSTDVVVDGITMWAETDAQHIAGMDPTTTLALVAEVRRLRALVDAEPETWPDGNRRIPGESFDDYNARMIDSINNIPDDQLARHPDGTLDTEPACWCRVPALLAYMHCPRHPGYYP